MFVSGPDLEGSKMRNAKPLAEAEKMGLAFFDFLGVKTIAEAREIDALTLLRKNQEFQGFWGFVIDGKYVPATYSEMFLKGKQHKIPVIIGNTSDEFRMGPEDNTIEA